MSNLMWFGGCAYLGWLALQWWCERPSVPSYVAKRRYRLANGLLWGLVALLAAYGMKWHTELVVLMPYCR